MTPTDPGLKGPLSMNKTLSYRLLPAALLVALLASPLVASAQNIAMVNGKPVPKARFDVFMKQLNADAALQGQALRPDTEQRVRDKLVMDEIMSQEAKRLGLERNADYLARVETLKTGLLIQTMFTDYQAKNPVTDADITAEYEKYKAQSSGTEYRARHILVEKEEDANALIKQIKAGAKFDELAKKNSKDPGSGENGGDLGFANPNGFVPEFSHAMIKLKKGEMTDTPVKSQFGYHIIKLEETRDAQFPPLEEVKDKIKQNLLQQKMAAFQEDIRKKAKTDYTFK
jgi:peptidyl-prolyl cis-trans isomerase C